MQPSLLYNSVTFSSPHNIFIHNISSFRKKPHNPTLSCQPRQQLIYFLSLWIYLFWTFRVIGIIQYVVLLSGFFKMYDNVFKVHLCCHHILCSFYGWIIFGCVDISYFVYPSADGRLDCFLFWSILNSATVNIHVQAFVWIYFQFSWVYLEVELLGHMVALFLTFWDVRLFCTVAAPFIFPPAVWSSANFTH